MHRKTGILLMNTGSPDEPTEGAVRRYLKQFLMDANVIDLPWPLRAFLVHAIILPKRPARSAEAYQKIWTAEGSPLIYHANRLVEALRERLPNPIEMAMVYGQPTIAHAMQKLTNAGTERVLLLPLFPQYASATVGSCIEGVKKQGGNLPVQIAPPFYKNPAFIHPIAEQLKPIKAHILFSYHGLPERHLQKTDPTGHHCLATPHCCQTKSTAHATCYRHQCLETTKAIVKAANLTEEQYSLSFQSRLGRAKWMEPYTEETLNELPEKGITDLAVVCPAFFCDCLETVEEIAIRGKETFLRAGGKQFQLIPALNSSNEASSCLETLIKECLQHGKKEALHHINV